MPTEINKRPGIITGLCVFMGISVIMSTFLIFSNTAKNIGFTYQISLAFSVIVLLVSLIGLWMMKKWAVIVYALLIGVVSQIILVFMGLWNITALIVPGIIIAIMVSKYKLMN